MRGLLPICRPAYRARCAEGIASPEDFEEQRRRSRRVLQWYRQYSELLRKLLGRQPELVDLFCGQGGVSEGIRRAGLAPSGIDWCDQPMFRRLFGEERFRAADAYLPSVIEEAIERFRAVGVGASPREAYPERARARGSREAREKGDVCGFCLSSFGVP